MASLLAWFTAHEAVVAGVVVAVIDFIISINPAAESNNILHWLLTQAQALVSTVAPKQ